ncbi:MAG: cytochrome P450 [Solirubrobacterales bacterium]|nr:cytochrome P450 [Solirubrobacterales bacterium]MBV9798163.1 cytochrome P450 [Solirubrobacterales bacterium]
MRSIDELAGPRRLPVIGNAHQIRPSRIHLIGERWCAQYGPVFRYDLGRRPVVGVADLDEINTILRARPESFRRWGQIEALARETGTYGVFSAEGEDWRRQRRLAVTALNADHLDRYFFVIRRAAERLRTGLNRQASVGGCVDVRSHLKAFTVDVVSALAFGEDLAGYDRNGELRGDIDRVFAMAGRRFGLPFAYWRYVKLPADRAFDRSLDRLRAIVGRFIVKARAEMTARPELFDRPENFLQGMLAAQALDGRYSEEELFGNSLVMLLAGEDTTAATLGWTVWYVSRHPEVQARLAAEADEVLGEAGVPIDHETTAELRYTEAVIREALRLRAPSPFIALEALTDTQIADIRVPSGTGVALFTRYATNQSATFPDARAFSPERWLNGNNGKADRTKASPAPGSARGATLPS